jgi:C4-dicarboxylate transporter DctM subunit
MIKMDIVIIFIIFAATLLLGVPIGIAIALTALSASIINPTLLANADFVFRNMVTAIDSYPLLAVPMFILSGIIMGRGGISKKLFDFFAYFVGNKTGGLPIAVIATCLFYGAISGSGPATTAAVGSMTIPILVNLGYDITFVTAMMTTAGGLGVIIPPSIPFVVYGLSAGESVGSLFIAGVLPGILIGICLMIYAYYYCKTRGENKEKLKENYDKIKSQGFLGILKDSFWALLTPVIILGGIYGGIVTPTEAAVISVVYSVIISLFVYRTLKVKDFGLVLKEAINTSAPVLLVVSTATVFGRVLTMMQAPQMVASTVTGLLHSKIAILLLINIFLLFVGMVMETLAAILILTPIFLPIVTAMGVNPIHFGVIMVVNLAIGFVTPPVGMNLYVANGMTGISIIEISRKAIPFILSFIIALLIITFVPQISLILIHK